MLVVAITIVVGSMWYTNILVKRVAMEEQKNVKIWADAIYRKTALVNYIEDFFQRLRQQDRKRVELLAEAYKKLISEDNLSNDLTFYVDMIQGNSTIPVILTDENDSIINGRNLDFDIKKIKKLQGKLKEEFSKYPPIEAKYYYNKKNFLYYKDSKLFAELRTVLDDLIRSFFSEVVINAASVPVIITDSTKRNVIDFGNIEPDKIMEQGKLESMLKSLENDNSYIEVDLVNQGKSYIFYKQSILLTQMRFFPIIQLTVIAFFLFIGYMLFSTARRSEQNQVWVGLAKETAHQLGTPLSSMMAWIELLKMDGLSPATVAELEKDILRLENVTDRFSKIGSPPVLVHENLTKIIYNSISYLKLRTSRKVSFVINFPENMYLSVPINIHLFEWVIENLVKNAVDAMSGIGEISISIEMDNKFVHIDIADTGKGIPKSRFKSVFQPGYTSKKRGWGLGLSLAKRIINDYHKGKIFVKSSVIDKGTTFRISLKKDKDSKDINIVNLF